MRRTKSSQLKAKVSAPRRGGRSMSMKADKVFAIEDGMPAEELGRSTPVKTDKIISIKTDRSTPIKTDQADLEKVGRFMPIKVNKTLRPKGQKLFAKSVEYTSQGSGKPTLTRRAGLCRKGGPSRQMYVISPKSKLIDILITKRLELLK